MSLRHIWAGSQQTGGVDCQTSPAAASHGQAPGPNLSPHKVKESGGLFGAGCRVKASLYLSLMNVISVMSPQLGTHVREGDDDQGGGRER